jgi:hypothetical protein
MIEVRELTKRYEDGALALDDVSYTVQPHSLSCPAIHDSVQQHSIVST